MTDREIMQQALDALEEGYKTHMPEFKNAITALRSRLAQPEQEHVIDCPRCGHCCPQRKPLTDEEIGRIAGDCLDAWSCARAIEAAHGIKE